MSLMSYNIHEMRVKHDVVVQCFMSIKVLQF